MPIAGGGEVLTRPERLEHDRKKQAQCIDLFERDRSPRRDVVPPDQQRATRAQGAGTRRERRLAGIALIEAPAEHAIAYDEVERSGRDMTIEILRLVDDVARRAVAAAARILIDRRVVPTGENRFIVPGERRAADEQPPVEHHFGSHRRGG